LFLFDQEKLILANVLSAELIGQSVMDVLAMRI
jgi:hypothetical protein